MKLVVGLGNPGAKYLWTRHNFGFIALDFWAILLGVKWQDKPKWQAQIAEVEIADEKALLVKPQAFYNDSGEVVQQVANFYKIPTSDILVVCDDFNLPFGELRYRTDGSAGGNNGLSSIISHFGENVKRLRLGTGNDMRAKMGDTDFVLGQFTEAEKAELPDLLPKIIAKIAESL
ncbi:MAG: aminoacyl-tRNA hydrolase [Candidatus Nomurabacteria bacterium]|jgi:PTH1 family peptidyl-tRNA hydrolase|nr:aminoacyl-tRNA hydrolase [Candidatus Nomurabacteria bacterium]